MSHRHHPLLRSLPALALAALIFILSGTPGGRVDNALAWVLAQVARMLPAAVQPPAAGGIEIDWLKVGHGVGYFLLGMAVLFALPSRWRAAPGLALALCALYALSDEVHQSFIPGRSASVRDLWIDSLAALGGILLMLFWCQRQRQGASR